MIESKDMQKRMIGKSYSEKDIQKIAEEFFASTAAIQNVVSELQNHAETVFEKMMQINGNPNDLRMMSRDRKELIHEMGESIIYAGKAVSILNETAITMTRMKADFLKLVTDCAGSPEHQIAKFDGITLEERQMLLDTMDKPFDSLEELATKLKNLIG